MVRFLMGWWRARAARPLLWWVAALLLYVALPLPASFVLLLIVGLGVALTVTAQRVRESGRRAVEHAARSWGIAERLATAVEDRIRRAPTPGVRQGAYGSPASRLAASTAVYDPGALLSAVAAVLAAEGVPTDAAPALGACAQLLTWQRISLIPGAPAPTACALATGLRPGTQRHHRTVPVFMFAGCVSAVLMLDGSLPPHLGPEATNALVEASRRVLVALGIAPDSRPGSPEVWPVMADIIGTAQHRGGAA